MLADSAKLDVVDLPEHLVHLNREPAMNDTGPSSSLAAQEKRMVEEALHAAGGNQSEAARRLGIGRDALRYKIKRYDLSPS